MPCPPSESVSRHHESVQSSLERLRLYGVPPKEFPHKSQSLRMHSQVNVPSHFPGKTVVRFSIFSCRIEIHIHRKKLSSGSGTNAVQGEHYSFLPWEAKLQDGCRN